MAAVWALETNERQTRQTWLPSCPPRSRSSAGDYAGVFLPVSYTVICTLGEQGDNGGGEGLACVHTWYLLFPGGKLEGMRAEMGRYYAWVSLAAQTNVLGLARAGCWVQGLEYAICQWDTGQPVTAFKFSICYFESTLSAIFKKVSLLLPLQNQPWNLVLCSMGMQSHVHTPRHLPSSQSVCKHIFTYLPDPFLKK